MAILKKGSRKIVVDDVIYRWRIRRKPSCIEKHQGTNLNVTIELYENPQSVLHISFPWVKYNEYFKIAEKPVTPKLIEQCIKNGWQKGWQPNQNRSFEMIHKTT